MILGYRDKRTEAFASGERVREFSGFERQGWKRLEILDAATGVDDLRALSSNRVESLRGDRRAQFSIRINLQWRICFEWPVGATGPSNVESSITTEQEESPCSDPRSTLARFSATN